MCILGVNLYAPGSICFDQSNTDNATAPVWLDLSLFFATGRLILLKVKVLLRVLLIWMQKLGWLTPALVISLVSVHLCGQFGCSWFSGAVPVTGQLVLTAVMESRVCVHWSDGCFLSAYAPLMCHFSYKFYVRLSTTLTMRLLWKTKYSQK